MQPDCNKCMHCSVDGWCRVLDYAGSNPAYRGHCLYFSPVPSVAAETTQKATAEANARGEGYKADSDKPRWDLLPWGPAEDVVKVLTVGATKYAPENWQKVPDARRRYFAAAMRHLVAWERGEIADQETGLPHLSHATCCLLFAAWFDRRSS